MEFGQKNEEWRRQTRRNGLPYNEDQLESKSLRICLKTFRLQLVGDTNSYQDVGSKIFNWKDSDIATTDRPPSNRLTTVSEILILLNINNVLHIIVLYSSS